MIAIRRTSFLASTTRTKNEQKLQDDRAQLDAESARPYNRVLVELTALGQLMRDQREVPDGNRIEPVAMRP